MSQGKDYYHYSPSLAAAATFAALFGTTTLFHLYQVLRTKTWYFTAFIIGGLCVIFVSPSIRVQFIAEYDGVDTVETIGFAARARNAEQTPDWNFAIYVVETLGIILAPTLFSASIYMEIGRIMLLTKGEA